VTWLTQTCKIRCIQFFREQVDEIFALKEMKNVSVVTKMGTIRHSSMGKNFEKNGTLFETNWKRLMLYFVSFGPFYEAVETKREFENRTLENS